MTTQANLENINFMSLSAYNQLSTHETDELYFVPTPESSTTQKGIVQLCTASETSALSSDSKAVTPASLATVLSGKASVSSVSSAVATHNTATSNIHTTLFAGKQDVRTTVADTASTTATIAITAGKDFTFATALTSLTISSVETSFTESTVTFTSGSTISVVLPQGISQLGSTVNFEANKTYVMSFWNGMLLVGVQA